MPEFATVPGHPELPAGEHLAWPKSGLIDRRTAKLLVVDDDEASGTTAAAWLEAKGYPVHRANSPAAADRFLAQGSYALILSDVNMPGNFRLEWIEAQLQRSECPPILLFTGSPDLETACRAANLPVAGYLLKPVEFTAVDRLIQRTLQDRALREDLAGLATEVAEAFNPATGKFTEQELRLVAQLERLSATLPTNRGRPNQSPDTIVWREAIQDTIAVLEKTKHSFRSKDLGHLRQRLEKVLHA